MKKCRLLEVKMNEASAALKEEMERIWPEGKYIYFKIRKGQTTVSAGEVIGHDAAYLRVRMDSPGGKIVDVHYSKIEG